MAFQGMERKLAAILSGDVVGYSRLMAEDEAGTIRRLESYRAEVTNLVADHRGRVADFTGDNFLAEFPTALEAVEAAIETQRVLKARNEGLPENRRMEFRIGIHLGDVTTDGERIYGDGVNIAARLQELAEPSEICVSAEVRRQVTSRVPVSFEDLGEWQPKNISEPVRVLRVKVVAAPSKTPSRSMRRAGLAAGVLTVLGAVGLGGWGAYTRLTAGPSAANSAPIRSIAVLPLENLSGDPDQEYFADGLTEEITNALVKVPGLRVAARTSAFTFKGRKEDVRTIGRELDVDGVVEGSVRRSGDQLRMTAQLVRTADGFHLWSHSYDRQLEDVFAIQSEIAAAVVTALRVELDEAMEPGALVEPPTADLEAYNDYLRGRHHLYAYTSADTRLAIQYFERALARDPNFALAHTGLANAYTLWQGFGLFSAQESRARAWAAASRALETDPELAEAHAAMGFIQAIHEWDLAAAERSYLRGIELNPGLTDPHLGYWLNLQLTGRHDEALAEMERLRKLDPLSPMVQTNWASRLYFVRRFDEAASALKEVLDSQPTYQFARHMLAKVYAQQQRYDEAIAELEKLLAQRGAPAKYGGAFTQPPDGQLGYVYAVTGKHADALALLEELQGRSIPGSQWQIGVALIYMGLGDTERVFESLEYALQGHVTDLWMKVDPLYDPLRSDPRFDDLLRRIGFPES